MMDVVVVSKAGNYRNSLVALVKSAPNVGQVFVTEGINSLEEIPLQSAPDFVVMDTAVAKGELGFYLVSDGSNRPFRVRIRPPSFLNLSALPKMIEGSLIADVVSTIGSIDIVLGEIDR